MKTLSLIYPNLSDIKYKISKFPDGQQDIKIENFSHNNFQIPIQINSRFNSFKDLEIIICAVKALNRIGIKNISLYIPYILGARSDRKFFEGGTSYLVDVIAPILNSLNFSSVHTMDIHSDVASACINNLFSEDNSSIVKYSLNQINNKFYLEQQDKYVLISPDGGSLKKIYKLAKNINYQGDIICCSKLRDENGDLTKTHVPISSKYLNKDFIIIDDICDGGNTFINIAKEIKKWDTTNSCKIYLIVTHGIFSAGFTELSKYFNQIFCTNSYSDIGDFAGNNKEKTNIKQLNVF